MTRSACIGGFLSLVFALGTYANDSDRVGLLEKEIRDLKIRISKLEAQHSSLTAGQESQPTGEGWKSVANWRKLEKGMSASQVKELLGEPRRVRSSISTTWEYQNDGRVEFLLEELFAWREPEE